MGSDIPPDWRGPGVPDDDLRLQDLPAGVPLFQVWRGIGPRGSTPGDNLYDLVLSVQDT